MGKTKHVYDEHDDIYVKDETQWWDGYTGNDVILFDDFRGQIPFNVMLRILDRYPYQGQVKGGYTHINSEHIFITSCKKPTEIYKSEDVKENIDQMVRRIDNILLLKDDGSFMDKKDECMADCQCHNVNCVPTFNLLGSLV